MKVRGVGPPVRARASEIASPIVKPSHAAPPAPRPWVAVGSGSAASTASVSAPAQEPNDAAATVVKGFYAAFARRDARAMAACYAADARFTAPIYSLHGASDIGGMWSSLLKLGSDARVSSVVESSDGEHVQVRWSADYHLFGRPVHNEAVSTLEVRDGKIVSQRDEWSWSKWAAQAFPLGHVVDVPFVKAAMIRLMRGSTLAPAATR